MPVEVLRLLVRESAKGLRSHQVSNDPAENTYQSRLEEKQLHL